VALFYTDQLMVESNYWQQYQFSYQLLHLR
jgi:hypothetical protein